MKPIQFLGTLVLLVATVSADVSHLSNHYLPPTPTASASGPVMMPMSAGRNDGPSVTTTIEKQELRELPTQTEYVQDSRLMMYHNNNNQNMAHMPQNVDIPPSQYSMMSEMPQSAPAPVPTPATHYLPPHPQQQMHPQADSAQAQPPLNIYESAPRFIMPAHEHLNMEPAMPHFADMQDYYLPPRQMPAAHSMPTYQQYMEQMAHLQQQQFQVQQQPQLQSQSQLPAQQDQQNMAIMPAEFVRQHHEQMFQNMRNMAAHEMEPQPAHILAADGYHYKTNDDDAKHFRIRL